MYKFMTKDNMLPFCSMISQLSLESSKERPNVVFIDSHQRGLKQTLTLVARGHLVSGHWSDTPQSRARIHRRSREAEKTSFRENIYFQRSSSTAGLPTVSCWDKYRWSTLYQCRLSCYDHIIFWRLSSLNKNFLNLYYVSCPLVKWFLVVLNMIIWLNWRWD